MELLEANNESKDKFDEAMEQLRDSIFDLGHYLSDLPYSQLSKQELSFLKAIDDYCETMEELDKE